MKKIMIGSLAAVTLLGAGCTGSFRLMQSIYGWHRDFSSRWTDELCFLLSAIVIYPCAFAVDTVFLNSIEFWLGENPIAVANNGAVITRLDSKTALVRTPEGAQFVLTRGEDNSLTLTSADGRSATAVTSGNLCTMTAADGSQTVALVR